MKILLKVKLFPNIENKDFFENEDFVENECIIENKDIIKIKILSIMNMIIIDK